MSRRKEVQEAIVRILTDEVPEIADWRGAVIGAARHRGLAGTVSCDRVRFKADTKDSREATALFSVYILDAEASGQAEDIADKACAALSKNPTLDNWATDSEVVQMLFGAPQGRPEAGLAVLELEVKFDTGE
jgi:hypothetical protein